MKESYVEGLASYGGPEPCVHARRGPPARKQSLLRWTGPSLRAKGGRGCLVIDVSELC